MREALTDESLLERIALRDADALELMYDRYERPMFAFALRVVKDAMAAEEVVQELFVRVWHVAQRIQSDGRKGKISTWLFAVTRNLAIDRLRKQGRQPLEAMENEAWDRVCDPQSTEAVVEHKMLGQELKEAINELQTDQKQVLEWIYYMGYTQQEVADQHQIPLGTVKSRVRLALKQLRARFDQTWKEGARQ